MQIENTKEHFNISSYALYFTIKNLSEICMWGKIMVLYYMKRIGFLWHLSDVSHPVKSYNREQLWKIGMKTSELRHKKSKRIASHGFFSYIPVSKITLEDIQSMYLFFWWEKKKKVTQLKITPHEKNFRVVGGGGEIPVVRFFTVTTWDFLFKCKDWMSQNLRLSKFCGPIPTRISFSNVCR